MTNFTRSLAPAPGRAALSRAASLAAATVAIVALGLLVVAATARAVVTEVEGDKVGLQPRNETKVYDGPLAFTAKSSEFFSGPESFANGSGNPVVHGAGTYAIYWDPTNRYHGDWQELVNAYLHEVGTVSGAFNQDFAVDEQYTDTTDKPAAFNFPFHGAYTDIHAYPGPGCTDPHPLLEWKPHQTRAITCLTDAQVRTELSRFIAEQHLPTGLGYLYYLLTPPGVTVCLDAGGEAGHCSDFKASEKEEKEATIGTESYQHSFCSYHGAINPGGSPSGDGNTILYGMIPWTAGGLDDGDLNPADQTFATYCQDGGFNPASKPIEEWEGINNQEPNQGTCPSNDGFCDVGLADLIVNQLAIEQQNIVTDPMLNAWQDSQGNEVMDECRNFFAPAKGSFAAVPATGAGKLYNQELPEHNYFVNATFNEAAMKLQYPGVNCITGIRLEPQFTTPSTVDAGEVVGFDGMESDITLNAATAFTSIGAQQANYATYTWNFGDGTPAVSGFAPGAPACEEPWLSPCAASVFHSYKYGGTYEVTLTVKDVAGNVATIGHNVTVIGPPPPAPPGGGSGGSSGGGSNATSGGASTTGGGSSSSSGSGGSHGTAGAPVAAGAVLTHSLRSAVKKGLLVGYSVNEQVAGRFEVLLGTGTARRLGISGAAAVGLPAGSAPQLVIGKALLVTTRGGHNTVKIFFSKRTAARLSRTHKVSLMLRMVARGAGSSAQTIVVSAFTLSR